MSSRANYSCFFPVYGLRISSEIGKELTLDRVTLVDSTVIARRRTRYHIHQPLSFYTHRKALQFPEAASVYAIIRSKRDASSRDYSVERKMAEEELYVLGASFLLTAPRGYHMVGIRPFPIDRVEQSYVSFQHNSDVWHYGSNRFNDREDFELDDLWKQNAKAAGFFKFLEVLRRTRGQQSTKWRQSLRTSAALIGRSQNSRQLYEAFLLNMISMECLLFRQGERQSDQLPRRIGALFGWVTDENLGFWKTTADRLYQLRCSFVHDGHSADISVKDLVWADEIAMNLQLNMWRNLGRFNNKDDFIAFLDQVEARRMLGTKVRKKSDRLTYWSKPLNDTTHKHLCRIFESPV